jgi:ABC-2 type transport system permease protein
MRSFLVELTRFRVRRAIALMVLGATLLAALMVGTKIWETRPLSADDRAHAQALADEEAQSRGFRQAMRQCLDDPEAYNGPGSTAADCQAMQPRAEWFLERQSISLGEVNDNEGLGLLLLLAGIMVIIGTTFAGADWASGSMSNQLLFEPRRLKVWLAKGAAVLVGTAVVTAVIAAAFWTTLYLVAESRGIATGATVQADIRTTVGRGVLLAGLGALGAYALTMLLRHTVGTLAVLFAYAVGGTAVIAALPFTGVGRWSVGNNVMAWLQNGFEYYDPSVRCGPGGGECSQSVRMTVEQGAAYLGVVLLVVVALSAVSFRRRDVP